MRSSLYLSLCLVFSGCASKYTAHKKTPTETINAFSKDTSGSRIDNIIANGGETRFLSGKTTTRAHYWIKQFTQNKRWGFDRHVKRSLKYEQIVKEIFREHGLPEDLFYVGLIESGYQSKARSHANAVGPWQFIKETGRRYGLKINYKVDERYNIYKSTHAAAKYFQDLYNIFGSWELALAAYNAGEYGIIRRIQKANTRDFQKLAAKKVLPKETRDYVPKIKAARHIFKNASSYNIVMNYPKTNIYADAKEIKLPRAYTLKTLARQFKTSTNTLKTLNPDIKRGETLHLRSGFNFYVPSHIGQRDVASLKKTPRKSKKRVIAKRSYSTKSGVKFYTVKKGDTLLGIANRHHMKVSPILSANNIKLNHKIRIGEKLKIPTKSRKYHKVRAGDHLNKIAKKYQVTVAQIKRLNSLSKSVIYPGQKLLVKVN